MFKNPQSPVQYARRFDLTVGEITLQAAFGLLPLRDSAGIPPASPRAGLKGYIGLGLIDLRVLDLPSKIQPTMPRQHGILRNFVLNKRTDYNRPPEYVFCEALQSSYCPTTQK